MKEKMKAKKIYVYPVIMVRLAEEQKKIFINKVGKGNLSYTCSKLIREFNKGNIKL